MTDIVTQLEAEVEIRKDFECWGEKSGYHMDRGGEGYSNILTQAAWEGWNGSITYHAYPFNTQPD